MSKLMMINLRNYEHFSPLLNLPLQSISIAIDIGNISPVFTWYRLDTEICSIAHR